jgi:glycosyltransferase involved in cell wall biosynthesis
MPARILYLITELDYGGAERSLCDLALGLDRGRFEPVVACVSGRGVLAETLASANVPVHLLGAERGSLSAMRRLVRLIRDLRPDLLHNYLFHANAMGVGAAAITGLRRVVCSGRVADFEHPWRVRVEAVLARRASAFVCVSGGVRDFLARHGVPAGRLTVIHNGVDTDRFRPCAGAGGACRLLCVGRLHMQKGIDTLLDAAAIVRERFPRLSITLAGTGPDEAHLRDHARRVGLGDAVEFAGFVGDLHPYASRSSAFVLLSRWEGFPNALLQSMAMGLPVVATRVQGAAEAVRHGETGFLVTPNDPGAAAAAIERLLGDAALRASMGRAGRARVESCFGLSRMVEQNEALYERLLARGPCR